MPGLQGCGGCAYADNPRGGGHRGEHGKQKDGKRGKEFREHDDDAGCGIGREFGK